MKTALALAVALAVALALALLIQEERAEQQRYSHGYYNERMYIRPSDPQEMNVTRLVTGDPCDDRI
jgi:hypothetical protein